MHFKSYEESDYNLDLNCKVSCSNRVFHKPRRNGPVGKKYPFITHLPYDEFQTTTNLDLYFDLNDDALPDSIDLR
jgi:hypothetical protein